MKKTTFMLARTTALAVIALVGTQVILPRPALAVTPTLSAMPAVEKHRLIVLTDIEADPDDTESLVRLLLYSNQIDIEGMIATTSCWMKSDIHPDSIRNVIKAYGKVRANLLLHETGYPEASMLLSLVSDGQPVYGMSAVGDGFDTAGSNNIIRILQEDDDRPVWVSVWGGANTLAQALYKIKHTMSAADANKLIAKLRVYTISDQDDSGMWMRTNFPDLFYIVSPGNYGVSTWIAINSKIDGIDNTTISNAWLAEHIQQGHGPLGAIYPDVAYGMEGDTPSFMSLIPNGLNDAEHPDKGGWGGRYELSTPKPYANVVDNSQGGVPYSPEPRPIWTNANDEYTPPIKNDYSKATQFGPRSFSSYKVSLWRWRDDFQNDFAARMDWTIKPYKDANHAPVVVLDMPENITVKSGEAFTLKVKRTPDPDGDSLSYFWFQYPELGTYKGPVKMSAENIYFTTVDGIKVTKPETLEFIIKVTDKGTPPLSRYKRVRVTIMP